MKRKNKIKQYLTIILLYLLLSIFFTYPLITSLTSQIPGEAMDGYLYLWNIDTFWKEIFRLSNPFYTNRIFYPVGTNLLFHTYAPLISLFALPFLKNTTLYLNLLIFTFLTFAAFNMFVLCKSISKNIPSSFLAGGLFAFSPIMLSYIDSQHYYFLFASSFLPLSLLFCIHFLETGKTKYLAVLFVIFWFVFFTDYYISILNTFLILIFSLVYLIKEKGLLLKIFKRKKLNNLFLTSLVFFLPFISFFLLLKSQQGFTFWPKTKSNYAFLCSSNLARFIIPSGKNLLLKTFADKGNAYLHFAYDFDTPSYFLGWTILFFTLKHLLATKKDKKTIALFVFALFILLFSLGPTLSIGEKTIESKLLPYNLTVNIPFLNLIDCPKRFTIGIQLAVAFFLGMEINQQIRKNKKGIIILFSLLFCIEYFSFPLNITRISTPQVYKQISNYPDERTLLELPSGLTESKGGFGYDWSLPALNSLQAFWQIQHQKPRIGGYISRISPNTYSFFKKEPIISSLFVLTSPDGQYPDHLRGKDEVLTFIAKFNLGFIILPPNSRQEVFNQTVKTLFSPFIENSYEKEGYFLYVLKRI